MLKIKKIKTSVLKIILSRGSSIGVQDHLGISGRTTINSWEGKPPKGRRNQGEVLNHPEPRGCGWEDLEVFVIPVCVQVLNPWIS